MKVYRLTREKYAVTLNGKGSARFANRWNSKGTEIIYTSSSRALAMAEVIVHISFDNLPEDFVMMEIEISTPFKMKTIKTAVLEKNWNTFPGKLSTQLIGDEFINSNNHLILKVPSAVVSGDYNYLINPNHKDFNKVKIKGISKFPFDRRIFE